MGQLGNNRSEVQSRVPVQVSGPGGQGTLTGVVAIAAGGKLSLALRSDGSGLELGQNSSGQAGASAMPSRSQGRGAGGERRQATQKVRNRKALR